MSKLTCPDCGSEEITLSEVTTFMANTLEHYCHSVKTQDPDSEAGCLACGWKGSHYQLIGYGVKE